MSSIHKILVVCPLACTSFAKLQIAQNISQNMVNKIL